MVKYDGYFLHAELAMVVEYHDTKLSRDCIISTVMDLCTATRQIPSCLPDLTRIQEIYVTRCCHEAVALQQQLMDPVEEMPP